MTCRHPISARLFLSSERGRQPVTLCLANGTELEANCWCSGCGSMRLYNNGWKWTPPTALKPHPQPPPLKVSLESGQWGRIFSPNPEKHVVEFHLSFNRVWVEEEFLLSLVKQALLEGGWTFKIYPGGGQVWQAYLENKPKAPIWACTVLTEAQVSLWNEKRVFETPDLQVVSKPSRIAAGIRTWMRRVWPEVKFPATPISFHTE